MTLQNIELRVACQPVGYVKILLEVGGCDLQKLAQMDRINTPLCLKAQSLALKGLSPSCAKYEFLGYNDPPQIKGLKWKLNWALISFFVVLSVWTYEVVNCTMPFGRRNRAQSYRVRTERTAPLLVGTPFRLVENPLGSVLRNSIGLRVAGWPSAVFQFGLYTASR